MSRWMIPGAIAVLLAITVAGLVTAGPADDTDRARELAQRLRCPVCNSVSVAESASGTAEAMRRTIAEQIAAGRTDVQIVDYFQARYGEWVLLDPPASGNTLLVWLLPALAAGLGLAILATRSRRRDPPTGELSAADRDRVAAALERTRGRNGEDGP